MLKFRNSNILFFIIVILMSAGYVLHPFSIWYFTLPVLGWVGVVFYGCYRIDSGFFIQVKCQGDHSGKYMALTFDDGPSPEHTPEILDILKEENIKASFFCIGRNIHGNEMILKRIHEEGHTIGNHSYSHHFCFDLFSVRKMQMDLKSFDTMMYSLLKVSPRMFRPPYGVTNPNVRNAIIQGNYFPVGWNIRSLDTVITDRSRLMKRVISRFAPGAVILFHDSGKSTAAVLHEIIHESRRQGYQLVTVDHLFKISPYV